jgi:hypothetical protein
MHELVQEYWAQTPRREALARLRSAPHTTLLACFAAGQRHPAWVAKLACDEPRRAVLRREHGVLCRLHSHALELGAPRALAWDDGGREACLILSGLPGAIPPWQCGPGRLGSAAVRLLHHASHWIQRLQALIPVVADRRQPPPTVQQLAAELISERRRIPDQWPIAALLAAVQAECRQPPLPAVSCHGDFWVGNLLRAGRRLHVVDWNGLGPGSPLDDYWLLVTKSPPPPGLSRWQLLERQLFRPGPLAHRLRRAAPCALPPPALRLSFYLFLARRLRWEAGLALQPRTAWHQEASRREWLPVLQALEERAFPPPFRT